MFYAADGLVENLESGTWIGDVCRHDNVSHIKLKDLEGCDHSSNAANILFVQHVCSIKNSTNSKGMCSNALLPCMFCETYFSFSGVAQDILNLKQCLQIVHGWKSFYSEQW